MQLIILLFAAILPFIVFPIEILLPYPYIVEEVAKAILILSIVILIDRKMWFSIVIYSGMLFAVSETVLFMANIIFSQTLASIPERLLLTIPLHIATSILIFLPTSRDKRLLPIGLILASFVHFYFNELVKVISH